MHIRGLRLARSAYGSSRCDRRGKDRSEPNRRRAQGFPGSGLILGPGRSGAVSKRIAETRAALDHFRPAGYDAIDQGDLIVHFPFDLGIAPVPDEFPLEIPL